MNKEEMFKAVNKKIKDGNLIEKMIKEFNEGEQANYLQAKVELKDYIYSDKPYKGYTSVIAIIIYSYAPDTFVDKPNIRKTGFVVGSNGIELTEGIATFGGDIENKQFSIITAIYYNFNALVYGLLSQVIIEDNERQLRA